MGENVAGPPPDSVTTEARTAHVQALLDRLISASPIYTLLCSDARLESVERGTVTTHLKLSAAHVNSRGSLHGAVSAAIIDFVTGLCIASWDLRPSTGVSADMHISYLSTAKVGDTVEIVATAERVGGALAYATIRISKIEADGTRKLVTLGQHTKYVKVA
jgi:acyl-coenzyme A thioesterase 13